MLAAPVVVVIIVCLVYGIGALIVKKSNISPEIANKLCEDFFQDVRSQITNVPGYTIINGDKKCNPQEDELGSTDYMLSVSFNVAKSGNDSVESTTKNSQYLSDKLPRKNYPIRVENSMPKAGEPVLLCVSASRYIDNDGKDYPQGPPDHSVRYIDFAVRRDYHSSCQDL